MPSSLMSTQGLRKTCVFLIVFGLLAAGVMLLLRIRVEASSRQVEVVVDYNEVVALAGERGEPVNSTLMALRQSGATAVALQEETLTNMVMQGEITITPHPEATRGHYPPTWMADDQVFVIETSGMTANQTLYANLQRVYPTTNLVDEAPFRILVRGSRDIVSNIGLGLSRTKVDRIKQAGLRVVPRLRGGYWANSKTIKDSLITVQNMVAQGGAYPYGGTVIFDGETVLGYRDLIHDLAGDFKELGITYGSIEFGKQKGDEEMGAALDGHLLRVHSVSQEDLATLKLKQVVQRFALAVKDRNIRVLYVHLPQFASEDALQGSQTYVKAITSELTREGFSVNPQKPAHPFTPFATTRAMRLSQHALLALLFAGAGAALIYWILSVLPQELPQAYVRAGMGIVAVGALAALGAAFARQSEGRAIFGLLAAISFPLLSLTWGYHAVDRFTAERPARPLWPAMRALLIATAITVAGALVVAAIMSDSRYLVKVGQFAGVKFALGVPLVLFALLIVTDGVARREENFTSYLARCRERMQQFMSQPIYVWSIVLAVVGIVAIGLLMARSGNDSGVGVSNLELQLRSMLEQWMIARPRTKEFAFGHPLFLFAMVAAARGYRTIALLLLLGAAIGQTDVLNTYCHAHTPVYLSLMRTVNGLWMGAAIGAVVLLLFTGRALQSQRKLPVKG